MRVERFRSRVKLWREEVGLTGWRGTGMGRRDWGAGIRWSDLRAQAVGFEGWHYAEEAGGQASPLRVDRRDPDLHTYLQRTWQSESWEILVGPRVVRFGATGETVMLPRVSGRYAVHPRAALLLAAGLHAQPPIYREFLRSTGQLKSQKAAHLGLGASCQLDRALSARTEVFYRRLRDLISYQINDLRLVYAPRNDSRGYAYGVNAHLRGELSRAVGIASYSYLVTREDIRGDGRGYVPRPGDQRHTASAYLEDRMDLRPLSWLLASTFHIRLLYGSGFPHTPMVASGDEDPDGLPRLTAGERNSGRDLGYLRFDVGMAQRFVMWGWEVDVRQEVANVFDHYNVIGHTYLPRAEGRPLRLRNALGRRSYNLRFSTGFERE